MATQAQTAANRRNAAKSTGPRTTIGKAVVAQNALKHGLLAHQHVVLGEDPQQFEACRRQWLDEIQPISNAETTLAERIAGLTWRLKRVERLQNELFDCLLIQELDDSMEDFYDELSPEEEQRLRSNPATDPALAVGRMLKRDYAHERGLERLMVYERWIENSLYRSMKELRQVQSERKAQDSDGEGVSRASRPRSEGETPSTRQTPCGVTTNGVDSAKQSQFAAEEGGHSPPGETGPDHPMPHGQTSLPVPPGDSVKQSQSVAAEGGHRPLQETKQSQSEGVSDLKCEVSSGTDSAKQSQSPGPMTVARGLPRCVRRVAWHYHNTPRSS
jgi:hypothetical protein